MSSIAAAIRLRKVARADAVKLQQLVVALADDCHNAARPHCLTHQYAKPSFELLVFERACGGGGRGDCRRRWSSLRRQRTDPRGQPTKAGRECRKIEITLEHPREPLQNGGNFEIIARMDNG